MATNEHIQPVLEPEAAEFCKATDTPPFLYQLPPEEGRKAVDEVQSGDIDKPEIDEEWITVEGGPTGSVPVRIVKPAGATGPLPVVFYIHGAGWVFGNAHTHDRLVRELAVGAEAAAVFPEYTLSPEAKYPTAIEQNYAAAQWVVAHGAEKGLDATRFAVTGDSVGGNMSAVFTLMAKDRGDISIAQQVLLYPVTNADFDTGSYHQFAEHYFLAREGMKWFLGPVHRKRGPARGDLRLPATRIGRTTFGAAARAGDHRRGRRPARRRRGVRGETASSRRSGHPGALRRDHPRLHDDQLDALHPCRNRRHQAGTRHTAVRTALTSGLLIVNAVTPTAVMANVL